ncbi:zinc finger mym-type protein 4-like isoform x1 [Gigaspora margarita]|uniref:Zinc finger mym-type protein 4-like isoform x1 n=1 Tax=Gigaspora margarita TaxID=4874 RepID=A0A8H4AE57_GIGMA|nr:zinc finger mym-type protein 4-like isoform x1 [Gigaspora margarita]
MNTVIGNKAVKVRSCVQRTSYKASEKLAVIQEAKKIGVLAASRRFNINQSMISRWKNNEKNTLILNQVTDTLVLEEFRFTQLPKKSLLDDGTEDDLLYSSDKENSEIDNNEDLLKIVEKDSLSANELELED